MKKRLNFFSKIIFLFLIIFVSNLRLHAADLEAEFRFGEKVEVLQEGDILEGVLRFWPVENVNKEEFNKYLGQKLFDSFYVAEIISSAPSVNNADVFEFKAKFVVANKVNADKMIFLYQGEPIHVKYHEVLFRPLESKEKDFFILDQKYDLSYWAWGISLLGLIIFFIVFFLYREKIIKLIKNKKAIDPKLYYKEKFRNAQSREDFEFIYQAKDEWMNLLETKAPAHFDFLKTLNEHQYKKAWATFEEKEVIESFEVIRRSFE